MTEQEIEKVLQGSLDTRMYIRNGLKASELKRGHVYVAKNGLVMMYLGISSSGYYVFYELASCYMKIWYDDNYERHLQIMNRAYQVPSIAQTVEMSMTHKGDERLISIQRDVRNGLWEFPCKDYEDVYYTWYYDSFGDQAAWDIDMKSANDIYTSVKNLRPGELYYNGWDSVFVFLGRTTKGMFIWYDIYHLGTYFQSDAKALLNHSRITKNNKRVKPYQKAVNDPFYRSQTKAEKILRTRPRVDMTKITQQMLDEAAGEI